ncbi:MAG TPA: hypothetical protein VK590_04960 [Saprospiraceae bacterium]|nr:hypothetical protein [Saprospiraceae bacterium]
MKKIFFVLAAICCVTAFSFSQDIEPEKSYKKASKDYGTYNLDPVSNSAKLDEAKKLIDIAVVTAPINTEAKTWILKGQIYNEISARDLRSKLLNPKFELTCLPCAWDGYQAFMKSFTLTPKNWEVKDALKGLYENMGYLSNYGVKMYEDLKYKEAYEAFNAMLEVHEKLKTNGEKSILDKSEDYNNQLYITGLSALNANMNDKAGVMFEKLYKMNYDKPAIYEALYKINADKDLNGAYQYLEAGRTKYPDDVSLLFAEINHYLKLNKLDQLIDKLKIAIQKEPNNVSLYTTMGNVYDNLYQKEIEAGNTAKAKEDFDNAESYYKQSLEKDPKNFDANYSLGTLFYNKAASVTKQLNALADDMSKDGQKKYEAKKAEMTALFEQALPYFQKGENLEPNDKNTLIALKEISARMSDRTKSGEYKKRLEVIEKGGKNETPFNK